VDDQNQNETSDERGGAEAAAGRANNPGPPASEPPTGTDSARGINPVQHSERGINPVQHSERGINPVQHSERGQEPAGGEGKGGGKGGGE
jgi:hypothetical protein